MEKFKTVQIYDLIRICKNRIINKQELKIYKDDKLIYYYDFKTNDKFIKATIINVNYCFICIITIYCNNRINNIMICDNDNIAINDLND